MLSGCSYEGALSAVYRKGTFSNRWATLTRATLTVVHREVSQHNLWNLLVLLHTIFFIVAAALYGGAEKKSHVIEGSPGSA